MTMTRESVRCAYSKMHAQETNLSPVVGRNRERRLVKLNRSPIVGESERIANSEIMHAQVLGPFETVCAKPSNSPIVK